MKEKLIIRNFGPIKSVELALGRFNVLIGENATGKSTVAKVLAVCRHFSYIIEDELLPDAFEDGLNASGLSEFIKADTYVFYECENYSFQARRGVKEEKDIYHQDGYTFKIDLSSKSRNFENLLKELEALKPVLPQGYGYVSDKAWVIPSGFVQNDVSAILDNPFYLPTERGLQSIFSLGKNSIQNIADSLFNQFADLDLIARSFKSETIIEPLKISYKNVDGRGYVKKNNEDEFYSLYNGASGYKSAIPIVLAIKYFNEMKKKIKNYIIEEPELNLFPEVQNKLMQYLVDKTMNFGNSTLVTTHSPYTLTSLNNMMYAFQIGEIHSEKTKSVLGKKYWLNPNDVSVYMMLLNGRCENIVDKEGLIKAEKIDSVSSILNKDFNAIMDIELNIKE